MIKKTLDKSKELTKLMSMPVLDGNISLLFATGFFTIKTAPLVAFTIIAGPTALVVASTLGGTIKENVTVALFSGIIALFLVVFAAAIGGFIQNLINLDILKIFGGIALIIIGVSIIGLKIPSNVPLFVIVIGLILGLIIK